MKTCRFNGKARARYVPGVMNKNETAYAEYLEGLKRAGEIKEYFFECVKLKINKACHYSPDFMVIDKDGYVEFHEVKGTRGRKGQEKPFYHDDALVKIKATSDKYPFFFTIVYKVGDEWKRKDI